MDALIAKIAAGSLRKNLPDFRVGDIVRVHQRIREGGKERIQVFEGMVIAKKHGTGISGTFTVRRIASGIGVERVYPVHSPAIVKIERLRSSKVRRAKLYFLRALFGKKAKLKGWEAYASWEDTADEPEATPAESDAVESEVAETPEAADETPATEELVADDQATETDGKSGGDAGDDAPQAEGASDSEPKSDN